jgi:small subunit ribosomal protein S18
MASTSSAPPQREASRGPKRQHRKVCSFCLEKVAYIDYKEISRLRRFVSDRGKILPRRVTGTCARHQRPLTTALERARAIALLPYTTEQHKESRKLALARSLIGARP